MQLSINNKDTILDLSTPKVMGILNATPDSFFQESRISDATILKKAEKMLNHGASILDIGGYSTRPGASAVSVQEELDRVIPMIELLNTKLSAIISIDTFRSVVAREAATAGASIVNDVSAGEDDPSMLDTVAELGLPYIAMHKKGSPKDMQNDPTYHDVVVEVYQYLKGRIARSKEKGISQLIIDPGFGFGKSLAHNFELLAQLNKFTELGILLVGVSRKSMITKMLNIKSAEALNGTTVVHTLALERGAKILRVHDVLEAQQCIDIWLASKLQA